MKLTFLGTGTSSGVPIIGCCCKVCLSKDPRDTRMRCAILLSIDNHNILIDSGPDIRAQMLQHHIQFLDAILITHSHFDHIIGLDELRPFSWYKGLDLYTDEYSFEQIKRTFLYLFDNSNIQIGGGLSKFNHHLITPYQTFCINNINIMPLTLMHGKLPILGYKIHNLAYLTDVKIIPQDTLKEIIGIDILILDCLRIKEHSTHLNLVEALTIINQINPKETYLIHMSHELSHQEWCNILPDNIFVAYDGLEINIH